MSDELPGECCAKCRFYLENEHGQLSCHRYPPTVTPSTVRERRDGEQWIDVTYDYPATNEYEWCGEFQPRKDAKPTVAESPETPIEELGLPVRICNEIVRHGVTSIEALCEGGADLVFSLYNTPANSIQIIVEALLLRGMYLKDIGADWLSATGSPLSETKLSYRAKKAIVRCLFPGVFVNGRALESLCELIRVSHVAKTTLPELRNVKNCGADTISEIVEFCHANGINITGMPSKDSPS